MYKNKNKKSKIASTITHVFFTVLALSLILAFSFPLSKKLKTQYSINKEIKVLKDEISNEQSKNSELKKFIEYLNSDLYVEEKARANLNYKNENEKVVVVKDNTSPGQNTLRENFVYSSNTKNIQDNNKLRNINNWFKYFFN